MTGFPLYSFLLIPLIAAALQLVLMRSPRWQRMVNVIAMGALTLAGGALVAVVRCGEPLTLDVGGWIMPVGIQLRADMLSALMLTITGLIGFCGAIHGIAEVPRRDERRGYHPLYQLLIMGVCGAFLTNDLFNLYVWFELMLMASFILLALGGKAPQIEGTVKYVVLNILSSLIFLLGIGFVYTTLGSLNFTDIADRMAQMESGRTALRLALVFLFVAFAVKAGMFPLYSWLPASYHTPRHTVSAVYAGLLTKVGVYALLRLYANIPASQQEFLVPVVWCASLATMIFGVFGAASQFHTRRILSFHIISQIGYMTLGLVVGTVGAIAAAIFYIIHHILVKTNLFFVSSAIDRLGGGEELNRAGGLYRAVPWLAVLFLIPALSLGGIPPLSGFWAKLALIRELFATNAPATAFIALGVGLLTLYSMTKIWAEAFWKPRPPEAGPLRPITAAHIVPMVILAVGTVALSLYPSFLIELATTAAHQLTPQP